VIITDHDLNHTSDCLFAQCYEFESNIGWFFQSVEWSQNTNINFVLQIL